MTLSLTYECRPDSNFPLSKREVMFMAELLLKSLNIEGFDFDLKITDDSAIAEINQDFLGCVGPTNVLSFPFSETPDLATNKYLGEIVLSVDTLARETRLYAQVPEEHMIRLLAHALLHLAGYDHGQEMYALTDAAVESVAPIFRQRMVGWH